MIKELMRLKCADEPLKGYELEVPIGIPDAYCTGCLASGCIQLNNATKSALFLLSLWQVEFLIVDMVETIPQISAKDYFKVNKRIFPQVNLLIYRKKCFTQFSNALYVIGIGDWNDFNLLFHSSPV